MHADLKLRTRLKDPQAWIYLIAVVTVVGLCAGVFEPQDAGQRDGGKLFAESAQADTLVAMSDQRQP